MCTAHRTPQQHASNTPCRRRAAASTRLISSHHTCRARFIYRKETAAKAAAEAKAACEARARAGTPTKACGTRSPSLEAREGGTHEKAGAQAPELVLGGGGAGGERVQCGEPQMRQGDAARDGAPAAAAGSKHASAKAAPTLLGLQDAVGQADAAGQGAPAREASPDQEADVTATVLAAVDDANGDSGGGAAAGGQGEGAGADAGAGGADHTSTFCRQPSLLPWEPSLLPTLEVEIAAERAGLWERWHARSAAEVVEDTCPQRPPAGAGPTKGPVGEARATASPAPPPDPARPESPAPAPPSEAESRLAYAPPHDRPEGDHDPDVGGGAVHGVPVGGEGGAGCGESTGSGCGAAAAPAQLPAPEVAESRLEADLSAVLRSESRQLPPWHVSGLLLMCAALLLSSMFSKRQGCGSGAFWGIQAAAAPVLVALAVAARRDVLGKARVKKAAQVWLGGPRGLEA